MPGLYDLLPEPRRIDYDRMQREYPKVKAALTRAQNRRDSTKTLEAVERFLVLSDEVGCMPDDWPRWRNALEDAWKDYARMFESFEWHEPLKAELVERFQRAAGRFS